MYHKKFKETASCSKKKASNRASHKNAKAKSSQKNTNLIHVSQNIQIQMHLFPHLHVVWCSLRVLMTLKSPKSENFYCKSR